jgi:hypothetical protein
MISMSEISTFAHETAINRIHKQNLERIITETTTDSDGNEAVRITIVITPGAIKNITGDQALDIIADIQSRFQDKNDSRFPIIEYATEKEIESDKYYQENDSEEDLF